MLETKDIQSLFSYIKQLHPHCPQDKVPKLTNAVADLWIRSLDGYSIQQLYRAADAHAQKCRYWPSLSEIVKQLPPHAAAPSGVDAELQRRQARWSQLYREKLREELERLDLREFNGNTGEEYRAWQAFCETAGVNFDALLVAAHNIAYESGT